MKKIRKSKFLSIAFCLTAMTLGIFGVNLNMGISTVSAETGIFSIETNATTTTSDGIIFTAKKVKRTISGEVVSEDNSIFAAESKNGEDTILTGLDNGGNRSYEANSDALKNYNNSSKVVENVELDKYVMINQVNEANTEVENIYVSFGLQNYINLSSNPDDTLPYINQLSVTAYLNNTPIYTREVETKAVTLTTINAKFFQEYFDLNYTKDINGNIISGDDLQGEYSFNFTYREKSGNNLLAEKTVNYSFNVLNQNYYSTSVAYNSSNDNTATISDLYTPSYKAVEKTIDNYTYSPMLQNTLPTHTNNSVTGDIISFYNYNDRNVLPVVSFDSSKYSIDINRVYYTLSTKVHIENGGYTLSNTDNLRDVGISVTFDGNIATISIIDLGNYKLDYSYLYNQISLTEENSQNCLISSEQLDIFGVQVFYAKDNSSEDEFIGTDKNGNVLSAYLSPEEILNGKTENIPKTNQSPVWFKYLGTINSGTYENSKTSGTYSYRNGYKFTDNGTYNVTLNYTYDSYAQIKTVEESGINTLQKFSFTIENKTPILEAQRINEDASKTTLHNNSYTNKNVCLSLSSTLGIFDNDVYLEVYKNSTNSSIGSLYDTYDGIDIINNSELCKFTEDGYYSLRLYYGAKNSSGLQTTYTTLNFVIDTVNVGLEIYQNNTSTYLDGQDDNDIIFAKSIRGSNTNSSTNSFMINWDDTKETVVNATYIYAPFNNSKLNISIIDSGKGVATSYSVDTISSSLTYLNNTSLNNPGIYVFTIIDAAGNINTKTIILDNVSPVIYQSPEQNSTNPYNIFSDDVTLTWGEYKAIEINSVVANTINTVFENNKQDSISLYSDFFKTLDSENKTYYFQPLSDKQSIPPVKIMYSNTLSSNAFEYVDPNTNNIMTSTLFVPGEDEVYYYTAVVTDNLGISTSKFVELNMDKSQVLIQSNGKNAYGDISGNSTFSKFTRIYPDSTSNFNNVYLTYKLGIGNYQVTTLSYDYYALTYDKTSSKYPYAENPTVSGKDILGNGDGVTDIINSVYSSTLNANATASGYYEVTRIYNNSTSDTDKKTYVFVIDRNYIKDTPTYDNENNTIYRYGENIYFKLGSDGTTYKNFIANISNKPSQSAPITNLITTNKLPVKLNIPEYKYDGNISSSSNLIKLYTTCYVTHKTSGGNLTKQKYFDIKNNLSIYHNYKYLEFDKEEDNYYYEDYTLSIDSNGNKILLDALQNPIDINSFNSTSSSSKLKALLACNTLEEFNNELKSFTDALTYTVTIYDSTQISIQNQYQTNVNFPTFSSSTFLPNALSFNFLIEHSTPTGKWVSNGKSLNTVNAIINSNSNSVVDFVFTEPETFTQAVIDHLPENILITKQYKDSDTLITMNKGNEVDAFTYTITSNGLTIPSYTIELDATQECQYQITIQYEGNSEDYIFNGNSFFSQTQTLVIDKTAPTYTLDNLISQDDNYIDAIIDKTSDYYNFAIDKNYAFTYSNKSSYNTEENSLGKTFYTDMETKYIYCRQYDKYTIGEANMTSILPDNPDYSLLDIQRDRPRFSPNKADYNSLSYLGTSFYSQVKAIYGSTNVLNNYYEIIEVDAAGNYSHFSVYLANDDLVFSKVLNDDLTSTDEEITEDTIVTDFYSNISSVLSIDPINRSSFSINRLQFTPYGAIQTSDAYWESGDMWFTVGLTINGIETFYSYSPDDFELLTTENGNFFIASPNSDTLNEINSAISEYLNTTDVIINSGTFDINVYSRTDAGYSFTVNISGTDKIDIDINEITSTNSFEIVIPSTSEGTATYITDLDVYEINDGVVSSESIFTGKYVDINTKVITISKDSLNNSFKTSKIYKVLYKDNFGRYSTKLVNFSIDDVIEADRLDFTDNIIYVDGIIHTSQLVRFNYQPNLYTVEVYKNGKIIDSSYLLTENYDSITNAKTIILKPTYKDFATQDKYTITLKYLNSVESSDVQNYTFIIDTRLPSIQLKDNLDNILYDPDSSTTKLTTTKTIYLFWDKLTTVFNPSIQVLYTGTAGNKTYNYDTLVNGRTSFSDVGIYTVISTNEIDNYREFSFSIIEDNNLFYWVIENDTENLLTASKNKFEFNGVYINLYNTILNEDEYTVVANQDKNLSVSFIGETDGARLYKIEGTTSHVYVNYVAVATISSSTNILQRSLNVDGGIIDSYYLNTSGVYNSVDSTSLSSTVSWNESFESRANMIRAYVSYNDNEKQLISSSSTTLTKFGNYKFYFYDDSGNSQIFASNTVNETNYFELNLVNNVWYNIKAESDLDYRDIIQNEIFNESVNIQLLGTTHYNSGSLNVVATKNGTTFTPTRSGSEIIISGIGSYVVTLTAEEKYSTRTNKVITSLYYFTIIDKDEARLAYDYTTPNSQTITSIVKDNVDITNDLLSYYGSTALNKVFFSPSSVGTGRYSITVKNLSDYTFIPSSTFTYNIWINNEEPVFILSRDFGTSATSSVDIKFNKGLIGSQLGNCTLSISNMGSYDINVTDPNSITTLSLSDVGTYYVTLVTPSGQVVLSNKITITEPLNNVAKIILIIASILVVGGIILFLMLRNRMRVR